MAEFRLTPAAERDLESIWTYTVREWGVEQADRYIEFLTSAFGELADSPKTARAATPWLLSFGCPGFRV